MLEAGLLFPYQPYSNRDGESFFYVIICMKKAASSDNE